MKLGARNPPFPPLYNILLCLFKVNLIKYIILVYTIRCQKSADTLIIN